MGRWGGVGGGWRGGVINEMHANNKWVSIQKKIGFADIHPLSTSTKPFLRAHLTSSVLLPVPVFLNRSLRYLCEVDKRKSGGWVRILNGAVAPPPSMSHLDCSHRNEHVGGNFLVGEPE
jgi:hypothetical protein